jgi:hypothetical protein
MLFFDSSRQAPSQMRSVSQAANLFTNAVGSWLTVSRYTRIELIDKVDVAAPFNPPM